VCNWRHKDTALVGINLGVITKLHLLTDTFTRHRARKRLKLQPGTHVCNRDSDFGRHPTTKC
jgi:hypothetical protein